MTDVESNPVERVIHDAWWAADRLSSMAISVGGLVLMIASWQLGVGIPARPDAGAWPLIIGVTLVIAGVVLLVRRPYPEEHEPFTKRSWLVLAGLALMAGYILLFSVVGLVVPTLVVSFVWLRFMARESWLLSTVIALAITAVAYGVFVILLSIPFPGMG